MRPRGTRGCTPAKAQLRKTKKSKRSYRARLALDSDPSADNQVVEIARLTGELNEALERQRATADILAAISRSSFELQPILQSVVDTAAQLCRAGASVIFRLEGGVYRFAAGYSLIPEYMEHERRNPISPGPGTLIGRAAMSRQVVQIEDAWTDPLYEQKAVVGVGRSMMGVPLMRRGELIGVVGLSRSRVAPFTQREIELVTTFADQAVIAIENARLLNELRQSLEQQIATSEVLGVISRSKFDLQPVLQSVVDTAARLCRAEQAGIYRLEGGNYRGVAASGHGIVPAYYEIEQRELISPGPGTVVGRAAMNRDVVQIMDAWTDRLYDKKKDAELGGVRSMIGVPLMHDGTPIGVIALARTRVEPFVEREIELVKNFADQAVIAIENTRLLNELRQRTTDLTERTADLAELLEQQTATSEVLRVISSSAGDLNPVFNIVLTNATQICEAIYGALFLVEGDAFRAVALHNVPPAFAEERRREPLIRARPGTIFGRVAATKEPVQITDVHSELASLSDPRAMIHLAGARTLLIVPMLKDEELVGVIGIFRQEVRPFTDKQIALVTSFAAQAVIAIENTRLLNELRESLERQTATSEVLQVISSSPGDLQPVFAVILKNATRICEAKFGIVFLVEGDRYRTAAMHNVPAAFADARRSDPWVSMTGNSALARLAATKQPVQIDDVAADPAYRADSQRRLFVEQTGARSILDVPMLKDNELIGAINVYRLEVRPFTEREVELLTNFAAQAVIAIENARLLTELRQRTDELRGSVEELRALGEVSHAVNSTLDLQAVLSTIVAKAVQLSGTEAGAIYVFDNLRREFHLRATYGMDQELITALTEQHIRLDEPIVAQILAQPEPIQVADLRDEEPSGVNEVILRAGFRALIGGAAAGRRRLGGDARGAAPHTGCLCAQYDRPDEDVCGAIGIGNPECSAVPRNRGKEPAARRGEPAQIAVPRQYEPRATHPAQRHSRLHRADGRWRLWRAIGTNDGSTEAVGEQRQALARADQ